VLSNHFNLDGIKVLDLFAGTGSISFEFASRGAEVDLIEKNFRSIAFIRENIAALKIQGIRALNGDVFKLAPKLDSCYDIVFADPPYQMDNIEELPELVFDNKLLNEEGWFILEHSAKQSFNGHENFRELRKYGSVHFSIFTKENS